MAEEAPAMPSDKDVLAELQKLLEKADLTVTTERMLRENLENTFGVCLKAKKAMIREEVNAYLSSQNGDEDDGEGGEGAEGEEEEEEGGAKRPRKAQKKMRKKAAVDEDGKPEVKRRAAKSTAILSPELQAFLGESSMARPQIVKRIWDYIKANDLQNPTNRRAIICDDKMKTIFTPPINMFSMNKQLSRHIKSAQ